MKWPQHCATACSQKCLWCGWKHSLMLVWLIGNITTLLCLLWGSPVNIQCTFIVLLYDSLSSYYWSFLCGHQNSDGREKFVVVVDRFHWGNNTLIKSCCPCKILCKQLPYIWIGQINFIMKNIVRVINYDMVWLNWKLGYMCTITYTGLWARAENLPQLS